MVHLKMRITLLVLFCLFKLNLGSDSSHNDETTGYAQEVYVQKCCPVGEIYSGGKCKTNDDAKFNVDVYKNNGTHYWQIENADVLVNVNDPCQYGRISLEPEINDNDNWILFENGSLYMRNTTDIYDTTGYCLDNLLEDEGRVPVRALICQPKETLSIFTIIGGVLQIISTISLIFLTFFKYMDKKIKFDSKKCLVMVFGTMAATYLVLVILTFIGNVENTAIKILWVLRYYLTMVYIIWLTLFCIELYRNVSYKDLKSYFYKVHLGLAFGVPLVLTVTFCTLLEDIPSTPLEQRGSQTSGIWIYLAFYYIPYGLLSLFCVGLGSYLSAISLNPTSPHMRGTIRRFTRQHSVIPHGDVKIFYRSCCFIYWLIFICYIMNLILFFMSLMESEKKANLLILTVFTDCMGLVCVFLFFKKDWIPCWKNKDNIATEPKPKSPMNIEMTTLSEDRELQGLIENLTRDTAVTIREPEGMEYIDANDTTNQNLESTDLELDTSNAQLLPNSNGFIFPNVNHE